jgi:hypothetical protein
VEAPAACPTNALFATTLPALPSSCALTATMIVLNDMSAAPTAGLITIPHG